MPNGEYEWDVFLSYRRWGEWPDWVRKRLRTLRHWLGEELGADVRIFCEDIREGGDYPDELAAALARSAVLAPVFSRQYFTSEWCSQELGHMLERERRCGYRTPKRREVLVVGAVVHDGEKFPDVVRRIQSVVLSDYAYTDMEPHSRTAEQLEALIRNKWAPGLAAAIEAAPPPDPQWLDLAVAGMNKAFEVAPSRQLTVPGREV